VSMQESMSQLSRGCSSLTTGGSLPEPHSKMYAFKAGDDLRQDALVLQIFRIMDTTWAENGLHEVLLLPYNVLPVTPREGLMQFVPNSKNLSKILAEHQGCIEDFLEHANPWENDKEKALDALMGSVAAYCVATYLLGVGDRHLDNVMITSEGHFFHIDFGFILGEDPKPCAPSVRVPREIMDCIRDTGRMEKMRGLMGKAYCVLRRTARLWTSLLSLEAAAGGNGCSILEDQSNAAITLVKARLQLGLSEDEAKADLLHEVDDSALALLPVLFDKVHQAGLFWN